MGFSGVIVTDALDMAGASARIGIPAAAVAALVAGADLLCLGTRNTDEQIAQIVVAIEDAVADGTLPTTRLAEAIERVERLGAGLASGRKLPAPAVGDPGLDPADVARAFHVTDTAGALLAGAGAGAVAFVALDSAANVAVGDAPWGPFAAGVTPTARIRSHRDIEGALAAVAHSPVVVMVGKDIHRHGFAVDAVENLRAANETVVVDMGWPLPTFEGVDIATFGASRIVGQALIELIGRDSCGLE
jgi:beta-N-acetylhexosaminidase